MSRYDSARNQMVRGTDVVLIPSAARTTAYTGTAEPCSEYTTAVLTLTVSAVSTPTTLDVTVKDSADGVSWANIGTFTQKTGTGTERKVFSGLREYVKADAAVVGGFTFKVDGYLK